MHGVSISRPGPGTIALGSRRPSSNALRFALQALLLAVAVAGLAQGVAAIPAVGGPDLDNYLYITQDAPGGPLYEWVDISATGTQPTMTTCGLWTGLDATTAVPLGFTFRFYGRDYAAVRATSGGSLLFGPPSTSDCFATENQFGVATCGNPWTCSSAAPNQQVAAAWGGFGKDPGRPASGLYHQTFTLPNGKHMFVMQWHEVQHCAFGDTFNFACSSCCPPDVVHQGPNSFEVKLFEEGGVIEVHHKEHRRASGTWAANQGCMVQGIEGTGTQGGRRWHSLAYTNAGVGTFCSAVSYMPPAAWAIRYLVDQPPVAAFENYSVPPNLYHNGRMQDDDVPLPSPEDAYFHPDNLILFQDRSTDADGPITSWMWDFGDGRPPTAENTKQNPTYVYNNGSASYTVKLTVSDGYISSTVRRTISVEPNEGPEAHLQVPTEAIVAGRPALLEDKSTDSDGKVSQWLWDFGDNTVSTRQSPVHAFAKAGSYLVSLKVYDDDGAVASTTKRVEVVPATADGGAYVLDDPPLAEAGPDQRVLPGTLVKLAGHQTNGHAEVYRWQQVTGPLVALSGADTASPSFVAPALPGEPGRQRPVALSFELAVTDRGRTSMPDAVIVTVAPPNQPPRALLDGPTQVGPGDEVELRASASVDPDSEPLAFAWTQVLGPAVELAVDGATMRFTAPDTAEPATLAFEVRVTDAGGLADTSAATIAVVPREAGFSIAHRGGGAFGFQPMQQGQDWLWDFGDGSGSREATPEHAYAASGTYTVRLTLTDMEGATHTTTAQVEAYLPPDAGTAPVTAKPAAGLAWAGALLATAAAAFLVSSRRRA